MINIDPFVLLNSSESYKPQTIDHRTRKDQYRNRNKACFDRKFSVWNFVNKNEESSFIKLEKLQEEELKDKWPKVNIKEHFCCNNALKIQA
jgi:hypothetical protein